MNNEISCIITCVSIHMKTNKKLSSIDALTTIF
jgi:hypothetical protein